MEDHAPKTEADYKIFMDCVRDYIVFLENWIEENKCAREVTTPHGHSTGKPYTV